MDGPRLLIVLFGILLPYLARIPGTFTKGSTWLTSFFGSGPEAFLFLGAFNAICWGSIVLAVSTYRHARSAWFPVIAGFSLPALGYASVDLSSSSTASLALIFIPLYSVPLVILGWLAGRYVDRRIARPEA